MGWNLISHCPHVNLLEDIDTGDDEEDAGPPGPPGQEAAKAEDDGTLVLLEGAGLVCKVVVWRKKRFLWNGGF